MSNEAIKWALQYRTGNSSTKSVLFVLANYANRDSWLTHPSVRRLITETELNKRTVSAAIKTLKSAGIIVDTGERCGIRKQTVIYKLIPLEQQDVDSKGCRIAPLEGVEPPQKLSTKGCNIAPLKGVQNCTSSTVKGCRIAPLEGVQNCTSEPVINNHSSNNIYINKYKYLYNRESFPQGLNVDAWVMWVDYRKENGMKDYSPISAFNEMLMLVSYGDKQLATVQHATRKQWKHVHPINESTGGSNHAAGQRSGATVLAEGIESTGDGWDDD